MRKKNKHEKEPNLERWLVSYADFITLLFAVFVTLYAMSQVDKQKAEEVTASVRESFGYSKLGGPIVPSVVPATDLGKISESIPEAAPEGEDPSQRYAQGDEFGRIKEEITSVLVAKGDQDKVKLTVNRRGLVISLKEAGFFDSGSAAVRPSSQSLLEDVGRSIKGYANALRIEGHTDNVPVSRNFPSNWELSTARANAIVHYLVDNLHIPATRLSATGYGEYRPIADNASADGRAKNRRVDIVLLSGEAEKGEPILGLRLED